MLCGILVSRKVGEKIAVAVQDRRFSRIERGRVFSYRLRKEKLLSESTLQKLRDGIIVSTDVIEQLCGLLNCQPGDLLEHKAE